MTVGTVTYAAARTTQGEEIDGHADQYALAATAFHLLGRGLLENTSPDRAVISARPGHAAPRSVLAILIYQLSSGRSSPKHWPRSPKTGSTRCHDFAQAMQDAGVFQRVRAAPENGAGRGRGRLVTVGLGGLLLIGAAVAAAVLALRTPQYRVRTISTTPPPPAVAARMDLPVVLIGRTVCGAGRGGRSPDRWAGVLRPHRLAVRRHGVVDASRRSCTASPNAP